MLWKRRAEICYITIRMIYKYAKRLADLLLSAAALGVLLPLLIVIAVIIRLESGRQLI